jgi:transcriptional regulator with XRE-family HTH domain
MHPAMRALLGRLRELRESAGLTYQDAEKQLIVGPGWVRRFETGEVEPSLGTLAAVVHTYGSDLATFFSGFDIGDDNVAIDRHLSAVQVNEDLFLRFPMGSHRAEVKLENATLDQFNDVLLVMRDHLAVSEKREAVDRLLPGSRAHLATH